MAKSSLSVRVLPETLRVLAFGGLGVNYAPIGASLDHPSRIILIQNDTDVPILVSWDGVHNHNFIQSQGFILFDLTTNRGMKADEFCISQFTQFYAKQYGAVAPTEGDVFLSSLYAEEHLI